MPTLSPATYQGALITTVGLMYEGAWHAREIDTWSAISQPTDTTSEGCNKTKCPRNGGGSVSGTAASLESGGELPTDDFCPPSKTVATDSIWVLVDPVTHQTSVNTNESIVSPTFPVPPATGSLVASWRRYMDMPRGSGYVSVVEYRFFKGGTWSDWKDTTPGQGSAITGAERAWVRLAAELTEAIEADSVQLRYGIRCLPSYSLTAPDCMPILYGVLYDDFGLVAATGVPPPAISIAPVSLPQTTFVDGTIGGANCNVPTVAAGQCWPGIRGSDNGSASAVHDNVNSPLGDSIVITIVSPHRQGGMGVNWHFGYDKSVGGGLTIARTNATYNSLFDVPRVIYRLFDPATKAWSPFDSSALDADAVVVGGSDTTLAGNGFRMVWPPRDKVAAGATLPGGFTVNSHAAYAELAFLPHGTRLQYYFKAVDLIGLSSYQFQSTSPAREVADLPTLPGGSVKAPDILEFDVLPGVYPVGSPSSLLAGKSDTPILIVDGAYGTWSDGLDPVTQALRGLGVRADRYRVLQGVDYGNNIGGHELSPPAFGPVGNYFPNESDYDVLDSLATWYRIIILSGHQRTNQWVDEADAKLLTDWWNEPTGTSGGDRCMFVSGDDFFNSVLNGPPGIWGPYKAALANNVFAVAAAANAWAGTGTNLYPTLDDRFAGGGPGLAAPGTLTYPADAGCPGPDRFDGLIKTGGPESAHSAHYPSGSETAGIAKMSEQDPITDKDRNKALGYAYSFQFIRQNGIPPAAPNYTHSGLENRMRVLYKFLTSCRGPRTGAAADTGKCWPCPTDSTEMNANWAAATGFQTSTYGPLYAVQDNTTVTGVEPPAPNAPRIVNRLEQNRPNPFNPRTEIPFSLSRSGRVRIAVYDLKGSKVRTILDAVQAAGPHVVQWDGNLEDGRRAASGIYFYRIQFADGSSERRKMALLR